MKACEKHGGQLYPDDGQCELCKKGVVTPTSEQSARPANKPTGKTRTF